MFGAIAVMLDDAMLVAVNQDHSLLVRVDPEDDPKLLRRDGADSRRDGRGEIHGTRMDPGRRTAVADDATLDLWLQHALRRPGAGKASGR